jgi:multidrug efflux pump subunit AcrA (membrane-fusion protein)
MSRRLAFVLVTASLLAACGKGDAPPPGKAEPTAAAAEPTLLIAGEDLRTVAQTARAEGPVVTGSVQPERRADLRAEVSSVVLQALKENGDAVRRGDLLVRLDDTAIRDSLASAEESVRAISQAFDRPSARCSG